MIISFDPGVHIGIVIADQIDYHKPSFNIVKAGICMFDDRSKLMALLGSLSVDGALEKIIIEDFLLFKRTAMAQVNSRFETVKVIERITVYAEQLGIADRIVMQSPGYRLTAKGMDDEHKKALGGNRHLTAAYMHLRAYVFDQKIKLMKASKK